MLRRQCPEVLAGVANPEPMQKAPRDQENAFARLRLKASHLAQIARKGAQKRGIRVVDDTGHCRNEAIRRRWPSVLKRSDCRNPRRVRAERAQIPIDDGRADRFGTTVSRSKLAEPRNPAQIKLSRCSLVPLREKIPRDAIHLGAERP